MAKKGGTQHGIRTFHSLLCRSGIETDAVPIAVGHPLIPMQHTPSYSCLQVKRGVVPPCPASYSRKIYGSGPRFMSQDDGSDSEPELVVQSKGHWEKNLGVSGWACS